MSAGDERRALFAQRWPAVRDALDAGGAGAAVALVETWPAEDRAAVWHLARTELVLGASPDIDAYVELCRGGIADLQSRSDAAGADEDLRRRAFEGANVVSYNLAADLADCWPDDLIPRTRAHFEAGLAAAEDCVRWRERLGKDDESLSMAWWAVGYHRLRLAMKPHAVDAFRRSLEHAAAAAGTDPTTMASAVTDPSVLLANAYLGIAEEASGDLGGRIRYDDVVAVFEKAAAEPERAEDARFFIDQLTLARARCLEA